MIEKELNLVRLHGRNAAVDRPGASAAEVNGFQLPSCDGRKGGEVE